MSSLASQSARTLRLHAVRRVTGAIAKSWSVCGTLQRRHNCLASILPHVSNRPQQELKHKETT